MRFAEKLFRDILMNTNTSWAPGYAEPGYGPDPANGVLFGNWNTEDKTPPGWHENPCVFPEIAPATATDRAIRGNHCTTHDAARRKSYPAYACEGAGVYTCHRMERIGKIAEKLGYDVEWEDEWSTCEDCNRAVRTEPTDYSWTPAYRIIEDTIVCTPCYHDEVAS